MEDAQTRHNDRNRIRGTPHPELLRLNSSRTSFGRRCNVSSGSSSDCRTNSPPFRRHYSHPNLVRRTPTHPLPNGENNLTPGQPLAFHSGSYSGSPIPFHPNPRRTLTLQRRLQHDGYEDPYGAPYPSISLPQHVGYEDPYDTPHSAASLPRSRRSITPTRNESFTNDGFDTYASPDRDTNAKATPDYNEEEPPASSTMEQTQSNPPALEGAQTMESQAEDYNYDEAQVNKAIVTPATEPSSEPEASSRTSPAAPPSDAEPTPTASALTPGADEQAPPLH
ncbi:unnamed protein product [Tilletia caries]|uniref:Uncharacterized protein n=1 Tax=Tilletia caries TaxID=13290 RepID=A0ABN7IWV5_9BASI|nr:unnamed protein product [Tilletia caries]